MPEYDPKRMRPQDLRDSTVRTLGDAVSGLSNVVKTLSLGTARAAGRGLSSAGFTPSKTLGIAAASSIHPLIGALVKRTIEQQEPQMAMVMQGYMGSIKNTIIRNFKTQRNELDELTTPATTGNIRAKKRLQNDSYSSMYGSNDVIEAVDRLRISNAEWIKALGSLSPSAMRHKALPRAQAGGYVEQSGRAYVHKGEVISPANMVRIQTKALLEIRDNLQGTSETNEAIQSMSKVMGKFKTNFLDTPLMDMLFGDKAFGKSLLGALRSVSGMIRETRRKVVVGDKTSGRDPYFHFRSIQRSSAIETIAAATSATYAHVRVQGERQITMLKIIARQLGAKEVVKKVAGDWGAKRIKKQVGILEGLTRALYETGSIQDILIPLNEARKKAGGIAGIYGEFKKEVIEKKIPYLSKYYSQRESGKSFYQSVKGAIFGSEPPPIPSASQGGVIPNSVRVRGIGERFKGRGSTLDHALNTQISILNVLRTILYRISPFFNNATDKKRRQREVQDDFYKRLHVTWMNNNRVNDVADAVWQTAKGKTSHGVIKNALGFALGSKLAAAGAGAAATAGGIAAAATRGFSRSRKGGSGVITASMRGIRGALLSSKTARSALGATGLLGLIKGGKAAGAGLKVAGGISKVGKIVGSVGWPLLIVTAVIDGLIGVFRTGQIFNMAFKDTTLTMKLSAFVGGVIDGLWDIIRIPLNLIFKFAGSNFRLKSILKPLVTAIHTFLKVFEPAIKNMMVIGKLVFKVTKLLGQSFLRSIAFWLMLPFSPKSAIKLIKKTWDSWINFLIKEVPNLITEFISNTVKYFGENIPEFVDKLVSVIDSFAKWVDEIDVSGPAFTGFLNKITPLFTSINDAFIRVIQSEAFGKLLYEALPKLTYAVVVTLSEALSKLQFAIFKLLFMKIPQMFYNFMYSSLKFIFWDIPRELALYLFKPENIIKMHNLLSDGINKFFIDPILNVFERLSKLIGSIPELVINIMKNNPIIGAALAPLMKVIPSVTSGMQKSGDKDTKPKAKSILPYLFDLTPAGWLLNKALSSTAGEKAVMENNNLNSASLKNGIEDSSNKQVVAINDSSTAMSNTTTAVFNSQQNPFTRSTLWTNMNDIAVGASI
jgi:hypothetical protein